MKPASLKVSPQASSVKPDCCCNPHETRNPLAFANFKPVHLETWIFERAGAEYRYVRQIDFKTCRGEQEILEYLRDFVCTAEEDGFNVALWVDGAPYSHLTGNEHTHPWSPR